MKFYCLENCYTLKSIAFCSYAILSLNLSIFSANIFKVSSCFLCCLKTLVNLCSSIATLSNIETLLTRSRPCSYAFLFRSLFSLRVDFILMRRSYDYFERSSTMVGLDDKNLMRSYNLWNSAEYV